jgi:hypothetical protein
LQHVAGFDIAHAELQRSLEASQDLREHVDAAFAALVQCLAELKSAGIFEATVFLSVLSTEPSEYLDELEDRSIEALNQPALVVARRQFVEKWNQ